VLGLDAGPKKLDMIKKNKIKTLSEDEFLNMIATRGSKDLDENYLKKQKEEEKKIKETAKSLANDTV
jgi:replication factor C subunit 1